MWLRVIRRTPLAGNITSWGRGSLCAVVLSLLFPGKFESEDEEHVACVNKISGIAPTSKLDPSMIEGVMTSENQNVSGSDVETTKDANPIPLVKTGNEIVNSRLHTAHRAYRSSRRTKDKRLAVGFNIVFLVIAILFVPFLLFGGE